MSEKKCPSAFIRLYTTKRLSDEVVVKNALDSTRSTVAQRLTRKGVTRGCLAFFFGCVITIANAEAPYLLPCECTKFIGDCTATVTLRGTWVEVTANTNQCTRVDWFTDNSPQMTVLINGGSELENITPLRPKTVEFQRCKLCKDNRKPSSVSGSAREGGDATLATSPSPFTGSWTGTSTNIFGASHKHESVLISVQGTELTGTWEGKRLIGTVSGTEATASIPDGGEDVRLELIGDNQMRWSSFFGSGTLIRRPQ